MAMDTFRLSAAYAVFEREYRVVHESGINAIEMAAAIKMCGMDDPYELVTHQPPIQLPHGYYLLAPWMTIMPRWCLHLLAVRAALDAIKCG